MSSDETQSALSRAYELVEAGQYEDARAILDPILVAEPNNADAWWVYAHAVTSADDGRKALENVVRIDPRYPGASDLLAQARDLAPTKPKITTLPSQPESFPSSLPEDDLDFEDEVQDSTREHPAQQADEKRGVPVLAILAVVAAIVIVLVLVLPSLNPPAALPTATSAAEVVVVPTDASIAVTTDEVTSGTEATAPTRRSTVTPTAEGATAEAVSSDFPAVNEALAAFTLTENGVTQTATSLGNTLLVSVCSAPGREMRTLLPQVMNALAQQSPALDASIQAIGVSLVNCETGTAMLTVASDLISAQNYAAGGLSDAQFAATWKPQ
ncbi:MAG: tetratricopeptide repeat protein [Chloroflexota bacterium]